MSEPPSDTLEALWAGQPDGIVILDQHGRIAWLNPSAAAWLGDAGAALIGSGAGALSPELALVTLGGPDQGLVELAGRELWYRAVPLRDGQHALLLSEAALGPLRRIQQLGQSTRMEIFAAAGSLGAVLQLWRRGADAAEQVDEQTRAAMLDVAGRAVAQIRGASQLMEAETRLATLTWSPERCGLAEQARLAAERAEQDLRALGREVQLDLPDQELYVLADQPGLRTLANLLIGRVAALAERRLAVQVAALADQRACLRVHASVTPGLSRRQRELYLGRPTAEQVGRRLAAHGGSLALDETRAGDTISVSATLTLPRSP